MSPSPGVAHGHETRLGLVSVGATVAEVVGVTVVAALVCMTATGERRRGHGAVVALTAGLFFPITWAVWYVRDERPYRTSRRT